MDKKSKILDKLTVLSMTVVLVLYSAYMIYYLKALNLTVYIASLLIIL